MIYLNKQLDGKKDVIVNAENFPLLFCDGEKVRDIYICFDEQNENLIIQTTLNDFDVIKSKVDEFVEQNKRRLLEQTAKAYKQLKVLNSVYNIVP